MKVTDRRAGTEAVCMDKIKEIYMVELNKRVHAAEGKIAADFQYEPERAELKAGMKIWLSEYMPDADEAALADANRRYFGKCMAELVYEETVRPHVKDFLLNL